MVKALIAVLLLVLAGCVDSAPAPSKPAYMVRHFLIAGPAIGVGCVDGLGWSKDATVGSDVMCVRISYPVAQPEDMGGLFCDTAITVRVVSRCPYNVNKW